jgi:hypothetical protein
MKPQQDNIESRHFSRIQFSIPVTLSNPDTNQLWKCKLIDISLHGALISQPEQWTGNVGELYQIDIFLGKDCNIAMEARAVHIEQHSLGFSCQHIDLDSVTHLRRLVELNLGDEKILEREFSELLHVND